jgi:hypothetical protein
LRILLLIRPPLPGSLLKMKKTCERISKTMRLKHI